MKLKKKTVTKLIAKYNEFQNRKFVYVQPI